MLKRILVKLEKLRQQQCPDRHVFIVIIKILYLLDGLYAKNPQKYENVVLAAMDLIANLKKRTSLNIYQVFVAEITPIMIHLLNKINPTRLNLPLIDEFTTAWSKQLVDLPPAFKEDILLQNKRHFRKMLETVYNFGDYYSQFKTIMKVFWHFIGQCTDIKKAIIKYLLADDNFHESRQLFLAITTENFDRDCRSFLNAFNAYNEVYPVFSVIAVEVSLDEIQLKPPSKADDNVHDFWIDFNLGVPSVSLFCSSVSLGSFDENTAICVSINKDNFTRVDVERSIANDVLLTITLERDVYVHYTEPIRSIQNKRKISFLFKQSDKTLILLQKVLPKLNDCLTSYAESSKSVDNGNSDSDSDFADEEAAPEHNRSVPQKLCEKPTETEKIPVVCFDETLPDTLKPNSFQNHPIPTQIDPPSNVSSTIGSSYFPVPVLPTLPPLILPKTSKELTQKRTIVTSNVTIASSPINNNSIAAPPSPVHNQIIIAAAKAMKKHNRKWTHSKVSKATITTAASSRVRRSSRQKNQQTPAQKLINPVKPMRRRIGTKGQSSPETSDSCSDSSQAESRAPVNSQPCRMDVLPSPFSSSPFPFLLSPLSDSGSQPPCQSKHSLKPADESTQFPIPVPFPNDDELQQAAKTYIDNNGLTFFSQHSSHNVHNVKRTQQSQTVTVDKNLVAMTTQIQTINKMVERSTMKFFPKSSQCEHPYNLRAELSRASCHRPIAKPKTKRPRGRPSKKCNAKEPPPSPLPIKSLLHDKKNLHPSFSYRNNVVKSDAATSSTHLALGHRLPIPSIDLCSPQSHADNHHKNTAASTLRNNKAIQSDNIMPAATTERKPFVALEKTSANVAQTVHVDSKPMLMKTSSVDALLKANQIRQSHTSRAECDATTKYQQQMIDEIVSCGQDNSDADDGPQEHDRMINTRPKLKKNKRVSVKRAKRMAADNTTAASTIDLTRLGKQANPSGKRATTVGDTETITDCATLQPLLPPTVDEKIAQTMPFDFVDAQMHETHADHTCASSERLMKTQFCATHTESTATAGVNVWEFNETTTVDFSQIKLAGAEKRPLVSRLDDEDSENGATIALQPATSKRAKQGGGDTLDTFVSPTINPTEKSIGAPTNVALDDGYMAHSNVPPIGGQIAIRAEPFSTNLAQLYLAQMQTYVDNLPALQTLIAQNGAHTYRETFALGIAKYEEAVQTCVGHTVNTITELDTIVQRLNQTKTGFFNAMKKFHNWSENFLENLHKLQKKYDNEVVANERELAKTIESVDAHSDTLQKTIWNDFIRKIAKDQRNYILSHMEI